MAYTPFFHKTELLLEGKQQAIAILKKGVKDISENHIKNAIGSFITFDPTAPKNKYVEILAKLYVEYINRYETPPDTVIEDFIRSLQKENIPSKLASIEDRKLAINLSKVKNIQDFISQVNEVSSTLTKSQKKKGIVGLTKGKDYMNFGVITDKNGDIYDGYIPLNWEGSKVIASSRVCNVEGAWCTAYQKDIQYWNKHTRKDKNVFIYAVAQSPKEPELAKLALQFGADGQLWAVWDAEDNARKTSPHGYFNEDQQKSLEAQLSPMLPQVQEILLAGSGNEEIKKYFIESLEDYFTKYRTSKGEESTVLDVNGQPYWRLKTNGWTGDTSLHDFLHYDLVKRLGTLDETFYDYYETRSDYDTVDMIQDDVKDPKAKAVVEEAYPGLYEVDVRDYVEFEEWVSKQENEIEKLNRAINRADEQSYMDNYSQAVLKHAQESLEEAFNVNVVSWDEIILTYPLQSIIDALEPDVDNAGTNEDIDDILNHFSIDEYMKNNYESMGDYSERAFNNIYPSPTSKYDGNLNYIEGAILDYGIE